MVSLDDAQFIGTYKRAHSIYTMGYERGYTQGHQDGHRDAGDAAELAARAFIALDAAGAHAQAQVADTVQSLDVPRFRERPMPVPTIKPKPTLAQFLDGLTRGGWITEHQAVTA